MAVHSEDFSEHGPRSHTDLDEHLLMAHVGVAEALIPRYPSYPPGVPNPVHVVSSRHSPRGFFSARQAKPHGERLRADPGLHVHKQRTQATLAHLLTPCSRLPPLVSHI